MTTPASTPAPPPTRAGTKAAFTHVTDIIIDIENVTKALKHRGIDDIADILTLDDIGVESWTSPDPEPKITQFHPLKRGEIGLLRTFIHFVHYQLIISGLVSLKLSSTSFAVILST
jgi:hypothetical protein